MSRKEKPPFAPWEDPNEGLDYPHGTCPARDSSDDLKDPIAGCPDCRARGKGATIAEYDYDARFRSGHTGSYRDAETVGHTSSERTTRTCSLTATISLKTGVVRPCSPRSVTGLA